MKCAIATTALATLLAGMLVPAAPAALGVPEATADTDMDTAAARTQIAQDASLEIGTLSYENADETVSFTIADESVTAGPGTRYDVEFISPSGEVLATYHDIAAGTGQTFRFGGAAALKPGAYSFRISRLGEDGLPVAEHLVDGEVRLTEAVVTGRNVKFRKAYVTSESRDIYADGTGELMYLFSDFDITEFGTPAKGCVDLHWVVNGKRWKWSEDAPVVECSRNEFMLTAYRLTKADKKAIKRVQKLISKLNRIKKPTKAQIRKVKAAHAKLTAHQKEGLKGYKRAIRNASERA